MSEAHADESLPYIVTIDDDPVICSLLETIVNLKSFSFPTVTELLAKKDLLKPVGVFVDIHLAENECGLDIVPIIRKVWPLAPVIVMTGDDSEALISRALSAGANDFILKPLRPTEVIARLNARRNDLKVRSEAKSLKIGDIVLDFQHKTLTGPKGQQFQSNREMGILAYLIQSHGTVLDKESIKNHVWGKVSVSNNALDRKIFEVRKSVREASNLLEIKTVYGKGVVLQYSSYDENKILLEDKDHELSRIQV